MSKADINLDNTAVLNGQKYIFEIMLLSISPGGKKDTKVPLKFEHIL